MKNPVFVFIFSLFILLGCQGSSPRERQRQTHVDFVKAKKLIVEQKYKKGIATLHSCADGGHGGCAQSLGAAYYAGRWVEFDIDEATKRLSQAYQTGIKYDFAGVYSAISLAAIMCDPRNREGGYKRHRDWLQKAKQMYKLLAANKNRMHSKTQKVFSAVIRKINLMDKSITAESCNAGSL